MRVFVPVDVTSPSNELISGAVICETLGWCNINERQERKKTFKQVLWMALEMLTSRRFQHLLMMFHAFPPSNNKRAIMKYRESSDHFGADGLLFGVDIAP